MRPPLHLWSDSLALVRYGGNSQLRSKDHLGRVVAINKKWLQVQGGAVKYLTLIALSMLASSGSTSAQTLTLGEILDRGAVKVSKESFGALLPGGFGPSVWPDKKGEADVTYQADGTFFGHAKHYASGSTSRSMGTWTANPNGKFCVDEKLPDWGKAYQQCFFRFIVDNEIFDSATDSERDSFVRKKVFKR